MDNLPDPMLVEVNGDLITLADVVAYIGFNDPEIWENLVKKKVLKQIAFSEGLELTHFSGRLISFRERSSKWAPKSYIQQRFGNKWLSWSDPVAVQPI